MHRVGVHTSIAGGICKSLERAKKLGCNTLQIFSHNPRGIRKILLHPSFIQLPVILETPKKSNADDIANLRTVKKLLGIK